MKWGNSKNACENKSSFSTKKQAREMAHYGRKKFNTKQFIYNCPECHNYHLTSQRQVLKVASS